MACQALFLIPPFGYFVQAHPHRSTYSCLCRQQLFNSSFPSAGKLSLGYRDGRRVRGEYDVGCGIISHLSRVPRSRLIAASNLGVGVTSSCTEVDVDSECRSASKPLKEFTVREANLDEELWAAAWIRAESYCEEQPYVRYVESNKQKFAEQEFDALKRRLLGKYGQSVRCICLVAVSGQSLQNCTMNGTQHETILERVVGTLDLSIRQLSQGETFPGDSVRTTLSLAALHAQRSHRYGYIANVCVTKAARRNGIASSLLGTAIEAAREWGLKELFVHVNSTNKAACHLYSNYNFQSMQVGAGQFSVILIKKVDKDVFGSPLSKAEDLWILEYASGSCTSWGSQCNSSPTNFVVRKPGSLIQERMDPCKSLNLGVSYITWQRAYQLAQ